MKPPLYIQSTVNQNVIVLDGIIFSVTANAGEDTLK
jgi:hypothetical protein